MGLAEPRVTVIIPAYKRADVLPEALESLVRQTYQGWEAIVIDDASGDSTYEVAAAFAEREPRVRVLKLEENRGIAGARNAGIALSQAEFIFLLDSDDYLRERCLERLLEVHDQAAAEGRRIGVVSTDAEILEPAGLTGETYFDRVQPVAVIDLESMLERNQLLARALFSRAAFDEAGGALLSGVGGSDDHDLWLRMMERGYEAVIVREPLAVYRDNPEGDSRDYITRAAGALDVLRRALERGALTPRQRRTARRSILHYQALYERELLLQALAERRWPRAARLALRAVPLGLAAFVQRPSRWPTWARKLVNPGPDLRRARAAPPSPERSRMSAKAS